MALIEEKAKDYPSPTDYDTLKPQMSTKRFKIFTKLKKTLTSEIMDHAKELPGVGQYKTERKFKIKGTYTQKFGKGAYVSELEYLAN